MTKPEKFKRDLLKLLQRYDARLELTDHESERDYSMWVFFDNEEPSNSRFTELDLGRVQPKKD